MKERSWVYAKILFLILSINLFLCADIVECTERVLTVVNHSLEENKIAILNSFHNSDNKYYNGVKFGELSVTEQNAEYIAKFLQYIRDNYEENTVFLEIIFTMDKSWEKTGLFKNLKSTDEAIIFQDLRGFLKTYETTIKNFNSKAYFKLLSHLKGLTLAESKNMNNKDKNTGKDYTKKSYYVITADVKLQMLVNIIEKGISEFGGKYEYISYSFKYLHYESFTGWLYEFQNTFNLTLESLKEILIN